MIETSGFAIALPMACFSLRLAGQNGIDGGVAVSSFNEGGHIGSARKAHTEIGSPISRDSI